MNAHAGRTSVKHSIVVEAPIERAFKVFTEDFGSFKPAEHNMLAVDIEPDGSREFGDRPVSLARICLDGTRHVQGLFTMSSSI